MKNSQKAQIEYIVDRTVDAYSFSRYGKSNWTACVRMLLNQGLSEESVEAILFSKWMRWAADMAEPRKATASALASFMADPRNQINAKTIGELTASHCNS